MESLIVAICSILATLVAVWGTVVYPRRKEHRIAQEAEEKRQSERNAFLDGVPAIDGVTEGAKDAAVRLSAVEGGLHEVTKGQALLEQRMNEANGTGKRTEIMVKQMMVHLGLEAS